jgi:hypothetical protein
MKWPMYEAANVLSGPEHVQVRALGDHVAMLDAPLSEFNVV